MTDGPQESPNTPQRRNRQRRYGLLMYDVEIFEVLGLPETIGRKAFRQLDKISHRTRRFPQPIPLFGGRRFWPAVERYFMEEFGGGRPEFDQSHDDGRRTWKESFD